MHLVELVRLPLLGPRAKLQVAQVAIKREMRKARPASRNGSEHRIELRTGSLFIPAADVVGDIVIFNEVFLDECYRAQYTDSIAIDLGGHRGYFGAYALAMGAQAVYSFEPEPRNFEVLSRCAESFRASGHQWVIENAAVSDHDGDAELYVADESYNHSLLSTGQASVSARATVRVRSFAGILRELDLEERRVIAKLDIEGSECEVILGSDAAWELVDELFMEFHAQGRCSAGQLIDHLESFGLACVERSELSTARHFYRFARRLTPDAP